MISARKIRTLKPRVQLRRAADAFHEAAASDPGREYLDEVMDIIRASDVLDAEDKEKITQIVTEGFDWLQEHQSDDKEVYEEKLKELQESLVPLIGAPGAGAEGAGAEGFQEDENTMEHDDL